jgi:hypothetical protein
MSRLAELSGIAHNIAHHAGSGLSYISPHLAQALRAVGADTTEIDLLAPAPYPSNAVELQPLRLALATLRNTVQSLLEKHRFVTSDVSSVILYATPAPWDKEGYTLLTRTVITARTGSTYDSGWLQ